MSITFVKDEADKRGGNPLPAPQRPGFQRRWVRTKGYDAEGHQARMREAGYVPVERAPDTEHAGTDPRLKTTKSAPLDSTITRGDLMLMECPEERYQARRQAQQALTKSRTRGVDERMKEADLRETRRGRKE